jgi:hypothetical protein
MILPVALNLGAKSYAMFAQFANSLPSRSSTARVVVIAADYLSTPAGLYAYKATSREWVRALPLDAVMESLLLEETVSVYFEVPVAFDVTGSVYREAQLQAGHRVGADFNVWASRI